MGGGYAFQRDVLEALLELADDPPHEFRILSQRPVRAQANILSNRIQVIRYPRQPPLERLWEAAARIAPGFKEWLNLSSAFDRIAREAGIEFIWNLSATSIESDLPYLSIVWDLQHRLQPWFPEVSEHGKWESREKFLSKLLRRSSVVIAGTAAGQAEIERFYQVPRSRIRILPHPTPSFALHAVQGDSEAVLGKHNLPPRYIFYPAQFWPHKNHANLLLALSELKKTSGIEVPLVLVGSDHGNLSHIRQLTDSLRLSGQVHFLGFVEQEALVALYQNALALTYVTYFGPENLPPLEAFALGCPVIASRVAGSSEQLGDAALLVAPDHPQEIASAIKLLQGDEGKRRQLIERGKARAEMWTAHDFVRGVFQILDEFEPVRRTWAT